MLHTSLLLSSFNQLRWAKTVTSNIFFSSLKLQPPPNYLKQHTKKYWVELLPKDVFSIKHASSEKSFVLCFFLPVFRTLHKNRNDNGANVKDQLTALAYDFLPMVHNRLPARHVVAMTAGPSCSYFSIPSLWEWEIASVGCVSWDELKCSISLWPESFAA